jgi:hypothetical protein
MSVKALTLRNAQRFQIKPEKEISKAELVMYRMIVFKLGAYRARLQEDPDKVFDIVGKEERDDRGYPRLVKAAVQSSKEPVSVPAQFIKPVA